MKITAEPFGMTKEGKEIQRYCLEDGKYQVSVLTLGGIIQSICVPDKNGNRIDVVLGFDTVQGYENQTCYIGAMLGRCANRMAGSELNIGGKQYHIACNDHGICHLHGGNIGFDRKIWTPEITEQGLILSYFSEDGEEGYPGNLQVSVLYQLQDGALTLQYHAESDKDTLCNLSNHSYFNLAGHQSGCVGAQKIQLFAKEYTPLSSTGAPDGEIAAVAGTPLDLWEMQAFQANWDNTFPQIQQARGYDHNYLVSGEGMRCFAKAVCDETGITLQTLSDMPGFQLYTGNYLENLPQGKNGAVYDIRSAFCIETQFPPNAVHCPAYAQPILPANTSYDHTTIYQFGVKE